MNFDSELREIMEDYRRIIRTTTEFSTEKNGIPVIDKIIFTIKSLIGKYASPFEPGEKVNFEEDNFEAGRNSYRIELFKELGITERTG